MATSPIKFSFTASLHVDVLQLNVTRARPSSAHYDNYAPSNPATMDYLIGINIAIITLYTAIPVIHMEYDMQMFTNKQVLCSKILGGGHGELGDAVAKRCSTK